MLSRIRRVILNPRKAFYSALVRLPLADRCDALHIRKSWYTNMPYPLNLRSPQTYSEKLQWLKLHDRNPLYTTLVDKYAVKKYVADMIGEQYIIPTLGVWDSFEQIDFGALPERFVLKCTHDSGGLVICRDKASLDMAASRAKIERSLRTDYYIVSREWPYRDVPRRIIAEPYMEDHTTGELRDYKFFCFDGRVKWLFIATGRASNPEPFFDFFDADFNRLDMRQGHPNAPVPPQKPQNFELMKQLASTLSRGLPHVRADFYEVDGQVYFGELTFYHHAGWIPFDPPGWDLTFGREIRLPEE